MYCVVITAQIYNYYFSYATKVLIILFFASDFMTVCDGVFNGILCCLLVCYRENDKQN